MKGWELDKNPYNAGTSNFPAPDDAWLRWLRAEYRKYDRNDAPSLELLISYLSERIEPNSDLGRKIGEHFERNPSERARLESLVRDFVAYEKQFLESQKAERHADLPQTLIDFAKDLRDGRAVDPASVIHWFPHMQDLFDDSKHRNRDHD